MIEWLVPYYLPIIAVLFIALAIVRRMHPEFWEEQK